MNPGHPHDNGIQNQHVKFPDGAELELLTAPAARDDLTARYRRHLEDGDGPAYAGLYTPDRDRMAELLAWAGLQTTRSGMFLTFPTGDPSSISSSAAATTRPPIGRSTSTTPTPPRR